MIKTPREYEQTQERLAEAQAFAEAQRAALAQSGLTPKQITLAMSPLLAMQDSLAGELGWYEQARQGEIRTLPSLSSIGRSLIALRLARGLTQRQLAERLGVNEAQISKDERNEYHGISVERAQRVLDALDGEVTLTVRLRGSRDVHPEVLAAT
jgi:predicted XRE-type DNA-binding protein